jgi:hypothetical protein
MDVGFGILSRNFFLNFNGVSSIVVGRGQSLRCPKNAEECLYSLVGRGVRALGMEIGCQ